MSTCIKRFNIFCIMEGIEFDFSFFRFIRFPSRDKRMQFIQLWYSNQSICLAYLHVYFIQIFYRNRCTIWTALYWRIWHNCFIGMWNTIIFTFSSCFSCGYFAVYSFQLYVCFWCFLFIWIFEIPTIFVSCLKEFTNYHT